ncbi:uncharacterized protein ACIBXB_006351 [Morphnus guianensis]
MGRELPRPPATVSPRQQHAVPQGGQGEPDPALCLLQLQLLARGRQQLHLCQQDHPRSGRAHTDHCRCLPGPHAAPHRGPPLPEDAMRLYYVCTAPYCGHRWTE